MIFYLWLEEIVLPNIKIKDTYLISAIQQYIDHLKGLFQQRLIDKNMNENLENF